MDPRANIRRIANRIRPMRRELATDVAASADGRNLALEGAGAVVLLAVPSDVAWFEQLPGGIGVALAPCSRAVVVSGLPTESLAQVMPGAARDIANTALDLINVRAAGAYRLADFASPYITWWPTTDGPVLRAAFEVQMTFKMQVGGSPVPYPLSWHESMRFFRMSQTTNDLFDAFRNLYLALESILSHIEPVRVANNGRPEGEGAWTKRALATAERLLLAHNPAMTLGGYLQTPGVADAVAAVFDDLYRAVRTAIFHAKNGRIFALPQDRRDRAQVADALDRYVRLYTDLAEATLGARFLRSGLGPAGFAATASILDRWEVGVTSEVFESVEQFDRSAASRILTLPTARSRTHDADFRAAVLGSGPVADLHGLVGINSLAARTQDGDPVTEETLGFVLTLGGVHKLECLLTYQAFSAGHRHQYDT